MKPKLFLHAGTHKTGTTALQRFAATHRAELRKRGLLYPDMTPVEKKSAEAHHKFAHGLSDEPINGASETKSRALQALWYDEAKRNGLDVMISAEAMYRHVSGSGNWQNRRSNYVALLADVLSNFDVIPVLVFRRAADFVHSFYIETITSGHRPMPAFPDYVAELEKTNLRYMFNATLFRNQFGNCICIRYEDLVRSNDFFVKFFQDATGVDVSDLEGPGLVRNSLSVPQAAAKNYANSRLGKRSHSLAFTAWLRSSEIERLIHAHYGGAQYSFWGGHDQLAAFEKRREHDDLTLHSEFLAQYDCPRPSSSSSPLPVLPAMPEAVRMLIECGLDQILSPSLSIRPNLAVRFMKLIYTGRSKIRGGDP